MSANVSICFNPPLPYLAYVIYEQPLIIEHMNMNDIYLMYVLIFIYNSECSLISTQWLDYMEEDHPPPQGKVDTPHTLHVPCRDQVHQLPLCLEGKQSISW